MSDVLSSATVCAGLRFRVQAAFVVPSLKKSTNQLTAESKMHLRAIKTRSFVRSFTRTDSRLSRGCRGLLAEVST